jgi:hypothetical protein
MDMYHMWTSNLNYVKQWDTIVVFNATKDISNWFPKINSRLIYMGCFKGVLLNWKVENQHILWNFQWFPIELFLLTQGGGIQNHIHYKKL